TKISLEDHSHHSSKDVRSPSGPLTRRRPQCSDYATPISSSSAGHSRKRSRSSATSIPSTVHTAGALSTAQADLLPPHKRYMGTSATQSYESSDEESEPEEAKADDEADAEIQPEGTIEIRVNITTGIDIPNDLPMPDTIERLEQLEESVQGQTDQQARNMIADGERSSLLERVAALEGSNMRLQDALGIERVRADSL
ncbi:hypothetical protein Tco_0491974, partial [Tanacetum coccineum]